MQCLRHIIQTKLMEKYTGLAESNAGCQSLSDHVRVLSMVNYCTNVSKTKPGIILGMSIGSGSKLKINPLK